METFEDLAWYTHQLANTLLLEMSRDEAIKWLVGLEPLMDIARKVAEKHDLPFPASIAAWRPSKFILVELLADLRMSGWSVAVHNDYKLDGKSMTFWLFTNPDGRWVKGEGPTDAIALQEILDRIRGTTYTFSKPEYIGAFPGRKDISVEPKEK